MAIPEVGIGVCDGVAVGETWITHDENNPRCCRVTLIVRQGEDFFAYLINTETKRKTMMKLKSAYYGGYRIPGFVKWKDATGKALPGM